MNRPSLISSNASAILASSAGLRNDVQATSGPSSIFVVTAASALRKVKTSQQPTFSPSGVAEDDMIGEPEGVEADRLRRLGHRLDVRDSAVCRRAASPL